MIAYIVLTVLCILAMWAAMGVLCAIVFFGAKVLERRRSADIEAIIDATRPEIPEDVLDQWTRDYLK